MVTFHNYGIMWYGKVWWVFFRWHPRYWAVGHHESEDRLNHNWMLGPLEIGYDKWTGGETR